MRRDWAHRAGYLLLIGMVFSAPLGLHADSLEEQIKEIRARYQEIEKGQYEKKLYQFDSPTEPHSGAATVFNEGKEIVKIELKWIAGDHLSYYESFYYRHGELVFAYLSEASWTFTGRLLANGDGETSDTAVEHRVYFAQGQLLRHLVKEVTTTTPEKLSQLLSKTENRPSSDRDKGIEIGKRGKRVLAIRSSGDLREIFSK